MNTCLCGRTHIPDSQARTLFMPGNDAGEVQWLTWDTECPDKCGDQPCLYEVETGQTLTPNQVFERNQELPAHV